MRFKGLIALIVFSSLLAGETLWADQLELIPFKDNTLYFDPKGNLSNGAGEYLFAGKAGTNLLRRTTMAFDLSLIPPGSTITSVNLEMTINMAPTNFAQPGTLLLHRLTADWGEGGSDAGPVEGQGTTPDTGDTTWIHTFFNTGFWSSQGGDFTSPHSQSAAFGTSEEVINFANNSNLVSDVQGWVNNPSANFGWIVIGDEANERNARRFYARESENTNPNDIPFLTVDFTPPSIFENLTLTEVADGLLSPVAIANAGDDSNRLFIVEQAGRILIFDTETQSLLADPYLDIQGVVDSSGNEQGLLGLAFHPDFASNRQFFVYYIRDPGSGNDRSVVARYEQSPGTPNTALTNAFVLMEFEQDASNHNGGDMHFGRDGYLYIATGDGGGGGDTYNNSQNINSLKGKMLRIDVDGPPPRGVSELCGIAPAYGIPEGNAFPGTSDGCDEILHYGLRNPWKFSFDALTDDMYIGDVGQGDWEEVNMLAPGASGVNFGWPCFEATHVFRTDVTCPNSVAPIFEYSSGSGTSECSVTGGYVYRGFGSDITGYYIYGDYCSARVWLSSGSGSSWESEEWELTSSNLERLTAFGQDENCEIYMADVDADFNSDAGRLWLIADTEVVNRQGFENISCR